MANHRSSACGTILDRGGDNTSPSRTGALNRLPCTWSMSATSMAGLLIECRYLPVRHTLHRPKSLSKAHAVVTAVPAASFLPAIAEVSLNCCHQTIALRTTYLWVKNADSFS